MERELEMMRKSQKILNKKFRDEILAAQTVKAKEKITVSYMERNSISSIDRSLLAQ